VSRAWACARAASPAARGACLLRFYRVRFAYISPPSIGESRTGVWKKGACYGYIQTTINTPHHPLHPGFICRPFDSPHHNTDDWTGDGIFSSFSHLHLLHLRRYTHSFGMAGLHFYTLGRPKRSYLHSHHHHTYITAVSVIFAQHTQIKAFNAWFGFGHGVGLGAWGCGTY
jgi:hypothetical protein